MSAKMRAITPPSTLVPAGNPESPVVHPCPSWVSEHLPHALSHTLTGTSCTEAVQQACIGVCTWCLGSHSGTSGWGNDCRGTRVHGACVNLQSIKSSTYTPHIACRLCNHLSQAPQSNALSSTPGQPTSTITCTGMNNRVQQCEQMLQRIPLFPKNVLDAGEFSGLDT